MDPGEYAWRTESVRRDDYPCRMTIRAGSLVVKIEFLNHRRAHSRYIENLRAFVKNCEKAAEKSEGEALAVDAPSFDSEPSTQAPSQAQTLNDRSIYYHDKVIGKGAYGEVLRVHRARDQKVLAAKRFNPPANKRKLDDIDPVWLTGIRREFTLIKENPHVCVP